MRWLGKALAGPRRYDYLKLRARAGEHSLVFPQLTHVRDLAQNPGASKQLNFSSQTSTIFRLGIDLCLEYPEYVKQAPHLGPFLPQWTQNSLPGQTAQNPRLCTRYSIGTSSSSPKRRPDWGWRLATDCH